jgi:hypothetical protein
MKFLTAMFWAAVTCTILVLYAWDLIDEKIHQYQNSLAQ